MERVGCQKCRRSQPRDSVGSITKDIFESVVVGDPSISTKEVILRLWTMSYFKRTLENETT